MDSSIIQNLYCPIGQQIFLDPVMADDGQTYERDAITKWLQINTTSPITRTEMTRVLKPNSIVKSIVFDLIKIYPELQKEQYSKIMTYAEQKEEIKKAIVFQRWTELLKYTGYIPCIDIGTICQCCRDVNVMKHIIDDCTYWDKQFMDYYKINRYFFLHVCNYQSLDVIKYAFQKCPNVHVASGESQYHAYHYLIYSNTFDVISWYLDQNEQNSEMYPVYVMDNSNPVENYSETIAQSVNLSIGEKKILVDRIKIILITEKVGKIGDANLATLIDQLDRLKNIVRYLS